VQQKIRPPRFLAYKQKYIHMIIMQCSYNILSLQFNNKNLFTISTTCYIPQKTNASNAYLVLGSMVLHSLDFHIQSLPAIVNYSQRCSFCYFFHYCGAAWFLRSQSRNVMRLWLQCRRPQHWCSIWIDFQKIAQNGSYNTFSFYTYLKNLKAHQLPCKLNIILKIV
jgi:hypothetical protein